jgi:hypothetical protein
MRRAIHAPASKESSAPWAMPKRASPPPGYASAIGLPTSNMCNAAKAMRSDGSIF